MALNFYGIELSDIVAIIALVVSVVLSAILFYLGHTRSKKSEQIRIGRETWDRIEPQYRIVYDWNLKKNEDQQTKESRKVLRRALRSLRNELDDLVYLVENNEIRETSIHEHYRKKLFNIHYIVKLISKEHVDIGDYPETQEILNLVRKYHELIGKMKEYEDQDSKIYP